MVGEVTLSITRSWIQNLSLPDERSNRETSRRIGFYSVYLVSLQGLPFTLLYFIHIRNGKVNTFNVSFMEKASKQPVYTDKLGRLSFQMSSCASITMTTTMT